MTEIVTAAPSFTT